MANFTQLHLSNKSTQDNSCQPVNNSLSRQKTLFGASLLAVTVLSGVFLLITNGCSKGPAKMPPADSANLNPAPLSTPVNPPAATLVVPAELAKPVHKRVQRKAPTATYSDALHGISFRYPKNYILKTGEDPSFDLAGMGVQNDFVQPGGTTVAAVELPSSSYPGTDFTSALFSVSVNSQLNASQCEQFAFSPNDPSGKEATAPAKVKVGSSEFSMVDTLGGADKKEARTKYYHRFENRNCYEFTMGLATADATDDGLRPVNRDQVFRKLEQILATVKLQPVVVPEVAKGTPDHPVVEGSKE